MDFIVIEKEGPVNAEGDFCPELSAEYEVSVSEDKLNECLLSMQTGEDIEAKFNNKLARRILSEIDVNAVNPTDYSNYAYMQQWHRKEDNVVLLGLYVKKDAVIQKILRGELC